MGFQAPSPTLSDIHHYNHSHEKPQSAKCPSKKAFEILN